MTLGHRLEEALSAGGQIDMAVVAAPEKYPTGGRQTMENFTPDTTPGLTSHLEERMNSPEPMVVVDEKEDDDEQLQTSPVSPPPPVGVVPTVSSRRSGGDVRSLLHFMSVAGGDIKAALDKSAPCKRSVDHRKYLQKQLCRLTATVVTTTTTPGCSPVGAPPGLPHSPSSSSHQCTSLHMYPQYYPTITGTTAHDQPPSPPHTQTLQPLPQSSSTSPTGGAAQTLEEQLTVRRSRSDQGEDQECGSGTDSTRRPQAPHSIDNLDLQRPQHYNQSSRSDFSISNVINIPSPVSDRPGTISPTDSHSVGVASPPPLSPEYHSRSNSPVDTCSEQLSRSQEDIPLLKLQVIGATQPTDYTTTGLEAPTDELLVLDVTGTEESSSQQEGSGRSGIPLLEETVQLDSAWRDFSSRTGGQCMASPPLGESPSPLAPPGSVADSPRRHSPSPPVSSGSRTPPAMVVATSPVPEAPMSDVIRHAKDYSPTIAKSPRRDSSDGNGSGFMFPPEVADDPDPLFAVPGVIDPTRHREGKDGNTSGVQHKASIPLRQRQLPASFWKEPRPVERRAPRPADTGATAADLLTAHGAFFVPYPSNPGGLQAAKGHMYDSYKAMAELYGARFHGLIGEAAAAAAHRSAATGGSAPGGALSHQDYLLSAYGSKLPPVHGVSGDPTALSVVATAAAYHAGGMYPWPYGLLTGEAEKALAARLQGVNPTGHHPTGVATPTSHLHQHHHSQQHQHHHLPTPTQQQAQSTTAAAHHPLSLLTHHHPSSSSVGAGPHPMIHGHTLLYHRHSSAPLTSTCSTAVSSTSTASSRVVGSPPGRGGPPLSYIPGSSPPGSVWDPLTAMTAQSLLRQPPSAAAGLWRPIPTKTLSSYPSRFHPFADVH